MFKHIFEVADCTRPGGWWELEAPGQRLILWTGKTPETGSDYIHREEERELVALVRLGEAKPDEIDKFEKWHRDEFDRSDLEEYLEGKPWVRARYEHEKRLLRK